MITTITAGYGLGHSVWFWSNAAGWVLYGAWYTRDEAQALARGLEGL